MNVTIPHLLRQISIMLLFLLANNMSVEAAVLDEGDSVAAAPRVALVLGGGGAKGAAHVGALKVIEEAGIQPDIIVGTSIGAIVGGLYSIGYRAADLDELFRSQQWLELFTREAIEGNAIKTMLDSLVSLRLPQAEADSTRIPFACIASDLPTLSEVVLDDDSLARNMRASMSIPGLFKKVKFDGYVLLDGGMFNNLPVDVARQMGADIVIAVDLTVNHHEDDEDDDDDFGLSEIFDISKVGGVLGWLFNRPDFKKYKENSHAADIYINPDLAGYSATSFSASSIQEMIEIGEQSAQQQFTLLRSFATSQRF